MRAAFSVQTLVVIYGENQSATGVFQSSQKMMLPGRQKQNTKPIRITGKEDVSPRAERAAGWNVAVPESND